MEIGSPTYKSNPICYIFPILKTSSTIEQSLYVEADSALCDLPASPVVTEGIISEFLEKTKKYFSNPLTTEKVLRHLRHEISKQDFPTTPGWYSLTWKPISLTIKAGEFTLTWQVSDVKEDEPKIPASFLSTTPKAQSPVPEQTPEQIRSIQIRDSLIPVGDLPLSDLPPLSFGPDENDPLREEVKRRVREARLKVALAKLKAQRMEQKYYEKYGQEVEDSEDSSEFSTDSEEETSF